MRNKFLISFFALIFFAKAQNDLRLSTINGAAFRTYLNDSLVNEKAEAGVFIKGVRKDTVKIKVELENKLTAIQTLYILEKGKATNNTEFSYLIEVQNNKVKINFLSTQPIRKLPEPIVPKKPVIDTLAKYRNNVLGHYVELKDAKPLFFNNIPKEGLCKTPMPNEYINYLKILMSKTQVEDDKFNLAENTTRNNCISVSQLNKILSYINFEIEKLKIIRLSYYHITDKHNKNNLDSTFKLESSKRELGAFLKHADDNKEKTGISCKLASEDGEINNLFSKLSVYNTDTEKFNVLKKTYADYCYSVNQTKLILGLFIHDREKMDTAKLLYFYCVDKDNYLSLSDIFSYNVSVSELKEFVEKQKN